MLNALQVAWQLLAWLSSDKAGDYYDKGEGVGGGLLAPAREEGGDVLSVGDT